MLKKDSFSFSLFLSDKGLTRGWYNNRLNAGGRYFSHLLSLFCRKMIYGFLLKPSSITCLVTPLNFNSLVIFLKQSSLFKLLALTDIFAVDHPQAFDGRFTINYSFWTYSYNTRVFLRLFVNIFQPLISLTSIYPCAGWLEREVWDLYGIKFLLHPDLRRILTDYGFRGHPLRKDFPLVGFVELRYDDGFKSIVFEPVELTQDFRFFKFANPWASYR
jgi:NADH-quinone oxidoreductase subunit C